MQHFFMLKSIDIDVESVIIRSELKVQSPRGVDFTSRYANKERSLLDV